MCFLCVYFRLNCCTKYFAQTTETTELTEAERHKTEPVRVPTQNATYVNAIGQDTPLANPEDRETERESLLHGLIFYGVCGVCSNWIYVASLGTKTVANANDEWHSICISGHRIRVDSAPAKSS